MRERIGDRQASDENLSEWKDDDYHPLGRIAHEDIASAARSKDAWGDGEVVSLSDQAKAHLSRRRPGIDSPVQEHSATSLEEQRN